MKYDELIQHLRGCDGCRCRDCELKDEEICNPILMEKAADAIEELQSQLPKWIPVSERLPEPNAVDKYGFAKGYLVKTDRHVMMHTARYTGEWWVLWGYHKVITDNVTHWMPLPEPPKEDTDG